MGRESSGVSIRDRFEQVLILPKIADTYSMDLDQGVTVKKIRRFEEVPDGTKITERVDGQCNFLLQYVMTYA